MSTDTNKTKHVAAALLDGFDDIQNIRHLVVGARLAITGAEIEVRDRFAVDEILVAAEALLDKMIGAINAANELDIKALLAPGGAK